MSDTTLEQQVCAEIERLHRFFVGWFAGTVDQASLASDFAQSLDEHLLFISPEGLGIGRAQLLSNFNSVYGSNPNFRIAIRDVRLLRALGDTLLVSYTEWQRGLRDATKSENARVTSVLMTKAQPFRLLHVHETGLPEHAHSSGDFNF